MAGQWSPMALAYSAEVESATKAGQPWSHSYLQRNPPKLQRRRVEDRRDPAEMGRESGGADRGTSGKSPGMTAQGSSMERGTTMTPDPFSSRPFHRGTGDCRCIGTCRDAQTACKGCHGHRDESSHSQARGVLVMGISMNVLGVSTEDRCPR